jgi:hypothetical protein
MYGSDKIAEVVASLCFPRTPGRPANKDFAYRWDTHGVATRWVSAEIALLVFLKRLRTRGTVVIQLQHFFGRSSGWISGVFNAVLSFLAATWIPLKIHRLDQRVFHRWRLQDYTDCLFRHGFCCPGVCGFVDGTFHPICRPGRDGYNGLLQSLFYSGAKKCHGIVFELITFPDGMIGRSFGPFPGRHHDLFVAAQSGLGRLLTHGHLLGFRLFGDKAYLGFGDKVIHPVLAAAPGSVQARWNTYTSSFRIEVEHDIGHIYMDCAALQNDMRMETQIPESWFQAAVLMHNIKTCVYHSNQTALRFDCPPPSLSEYMQR